MTADEIIETLKLEPHPEGGCYIQTFRDGDGDARGHSTAIYYLLKAGERSHWHRVTDAAEVWHFYAGSPLKLRLAKDGEEGREIILGLDLKNGERPQAVVVANEWQSAESLGAFTLVGCTVAPGFEFSKFEMAPPGWEPAG
ncbi:putative cupin superfamily sugar epimerase [Neorhizobium galegae]|uniref:cupin domain-containing protein n=1 Tax=Rhizobium/Agrobacterium group TaxID=227290 RepID=UPI001AEB6C66|nr:putative cupin superfamily sugar epimerase [Neorhizobium galegae]